MGFDRPDYKMYGGLTEVDEKMLRKLAQLDLKRDGKESYLLVVDRYTSEGDSVRRLDQAGMLNVSYGDNNPHVLEVYAGGHSYISLADEKVAAEELRKKERKEDKHHDWKIAVFTVIAGIAGVVIGFFLGRL